MASHHFFHGLSAASFIGMWVVMMVPMMLPSLIPMLWRYREAVGSMGQVRLNFLTALVGVAYFAAWTVVGVAVFPFSSALTAIEMQPALARAAPIAVGLVVLIAGVMQFTAWKSRHLACCREASTPARVSVGASYVESWRYGVRLALLCAPCCANLMVILLVVGMMDLGAMAAVTAAITAERLAPAAERVARAIGLVVIGIAVLLIAQAAGVA